MRFLKPAGIVIVLALASYAGLLALLPPKRTVALAPTSQELFSVQVLRMAEDAPDGSYDSN